MGITQTTFRQAIAETEERPRRHLLLGNGFSIAAARHRFSYSSLMQEAYGLHPPLQNLFEGLSAIDFEDAMAKSRERSERDEIRRIFIETIASIHPTRDEAITRAQRENCANFLSLFLRRPGSTRRRGTIFTTNYDVMLYWVLVEHGDRLRCWDGFDAVQQWREVRAERALVFNLHGGLHIHELAGQRLPIRKLKASTIHANLIEAIRSTVQEDRFPIIVSEGSSAEKVAKITRNDYLRAAFKRYWEVCRRPSDALFTFGHSLNAVDQHITDLIGKGLIQHLYVAVFDKKGEERLKTLAAQWETLRAAAGRPPICVRWFDAATTPVWDKPLSAGA